MKVELIIPEKVDGLNGKKGLLRAHWSARKKKKESKKKSIKAMYKYIDVKELEGKRDDLYKLKELYEIKKDKCKCAEVKKQIRSINLKLRIHYRDN